MIAGQDDTENKPLHIAVIMDGNGRWAKKRGLPRTAGHQAGFRVARAIVEAVGKRGHDALTLFAFSSENWNRPNAEVSLLLDLFMRALQSEVDRLVKNNVHMSFIGERSAFPEKLREQMRIAEQKTERNDGLKLAIAVNYGGRWDIVNAARSIARRVQKGEITADQIDIGSFAEGLSLADRGEPDVLIRTGGEQRISNYLLWQLAYTEFFFSQVLWPDFDELELDRAIESFNNRQRRFGRTGEQVTGLDDA